MTALFFSLQYTYFVFAFPNLAKGPWSRNHTKIIDTYFLGYFQLQGSWAQGMASS